MAVSPNLDPCFRDLMTETCTIAPATGQNLYDEKTFGTAVTYQCRIVGKIMNIRDSRGEESTQLFELWLDTIDVIKTEDQLTLTGAEWIGGTPHIFSVRRVTDEGSHSHVQISCGWQYHRQGQ